VRVISQVTFNTKFEEELEKLFDTLNELGVDYLYDSKWNELLINGNVITLTDKHALIEYNDWKGTYDVFVNLNPDSVTLDIVNRQSWPSRKEIVIPIPAKKMWYGKPYLRIRFQS